MNQILYLKGSFEQESSSQSGGGAQLPKNAAINAEHLKKLKNDLITMREYWQNENFHNHALISAYYIKIAAKSNRMVYLLSNGKNPANSTVVGARFSDDKSPKHIITHYVPLSTITSSIERISTCIHVLEEYFDGKMDYDLNKKLNLDKSFKPPLISKTKFLQTLVDAFYIQKFDVFFTPDNTSGNSIISIFKTNQNTIDLLEKYGISVHQSNMIDDTTIFLTPDDFKLLRTKAPYLISMAVTDLSKIEKVDFNAIDDAQIQIPKPTNEPTIGVIDTLFDENVYFHEWVDFHNMLSDDIPKESDDYFHGTAVTSIIVDGAKFNPALEDGCGRFRVRHFGVATSKQFSSFTILKLIEKIIIKNKDIKVWNLSLGSKLEVNKNFISPEAAILDRIQYENDVIFVISGTNKPKGVTDSMRIGSPADSINSLVVNSVTLSGTPTSYSRSGPVLSFYVKPDISYYGGDETFKIRVCSPLGEGFVDGTSFAAPWISRKLAYLINVLGLSREVAKALIIHSATNWDKEPEYSNLIGYGIVPKHIKDIVNSDDDEIRFILSGISEKYNTYNYNIPVPVFQEKHPFIVKTTLCYFPHCSKNQGVDYTDTELDLNIGRLQGNNIKSINNNYQTDPSHHVFEEDARKQFRKWDNVKHIREVFKSSVRHRKAYESGLWGISLKTKERLDKRYGNGINFALIVSLKEISGKNRIEEFIKACYLRGWLVNKVDVKTLVDIYTIAEEVVEFDE